MDLYGRLRPGRIWGPAASGQHQSGRFVAGQIRRHRKRLFPDSEGEHAGSEFDDLLPNGARAFGPQNLRYVVILDEQPAGETLSARWEAYYTRGWDVSNRYR